MRIALISTPSSLSSFTVDTVSKKFNLTNYQEFYNQLFTGDDEASVAEAYSKLYDADNYCIKFMAFPLKTNEKINYTNINWEIFDKIIFTQRESITDQIISVYLGMLGTNSTKLSKSDTPMYIVLDEEFNRMKRLIFDGMGAYRIYKNELMERFPNKCFIIKYETLNTEEYVTVFNSINNTDFMHFDLFSPVPRKKPFRALISNYDEIEQQINNNE